ncbi:MAG: hypothetical protein DCO96_16105 [Fluviicola sp. XM-24bin1]|nr:MAG: hypothetical protein DCO96_16105 [Fluviicola sp. XM-24bin1]
MIRAALIVLVIVLAGCGEKKEKIIDMSDRTPKSSRNYDEVDPLQVEDSLAAPLRKFQSWIPEVSSIRISDKRNFLERFQPLSTEKYVWYLESGDSLEYMRLVFSDSIYTKSAFFNWLDRSGTSYFGANENIQKYPFAMLYTDTVLLRLSGSIDFKQWEKLLEEKEWMDEGDYWIKQRKFGKAQWFEREEDELKDLTDL